MILVTGGLGFIGSHTVRALLDQGQACVLLQRHARDLPDELADGEVQVEQGDVADLDSLTAIGRRHDITDVVHLSGSYPEDGDAAQAVAATRQALDGLLNIMTVAQDWGVHRVGVASTIGVYGGLDVTGALHEDLPLAMTAPHAIPTFKKIGELVNGYLADAGDLDVVNYRISGVWGPRGHEDPFFAAPALIHAAASGTAPDLSNLAAPPHAGDALDLTYVKDIGRGIALLQLADGLQHRTYNVASGRATSNADIARAITSVVPDAQVDLPDGGDAPRTWLDITRIQQDTGYAPDYDVERAAADYIAWLQAGHER